MEIPELDYVATVPAIVQRAARKFAGRDFLVTSDRRLTFDEFELESRRLATVLLRVGVGKGTRVGAHFPSGPEWALSWAACARIGALYMPMSTLFRPREFRAVLRQGDIQQLLIPEAMFGKDEFSFLEEAVPDLAATAVTTLYLPQVPYLRYIHVSGISARSWARSLLRDDPWMDSTRASDLLEQIELEIHPSDELMVIFTSGSTAEPKAVVHTHGSVVRKTSMLGLPGTPEPGSRTFAGMPFFWVGGLLILGSALQHGATVITQEKFDPKSALDLIQREDASNVVAWQSSIMRMRNHPSFASYRLSSVPALATTETIDPGLRHSSLGMTETMGPHSAGLRSEAPEEENQIPLPERLRGSWGAPLAPLEHRIVDPDTSQDLPEGSEGEIYVRGFSLLARMYKRERHEIFDDNFWFHTGDLGYIKDGYLFFTGRLSDVIKTRGANVSPREVEVALESYPEIDRCFVFGLPDAPRGQMVVAGVVIADGSIIDLEEVRVRLREDLSAFKVPSVIVDLEDDEVPLLTTGKPDRLKIQMMVRSRMESLLDVRNDEKTRGSEGS